MTTEEFYNDISADYTTVLNRLQSPALVARLLKMFLKDPSMPALEKAVQEENAEEAFRAVHTLKGVTLNLELKNLSAPAVELTELLRGGAFKPGWRPVYDKLAAEYSRTVAAIAQLG